MSNLWRVHVTIVASEPEFGPVPETSVMLRAANRNNGIGRRGSAWFQDIDARRLALMQPHLHIR